MRIGFMFWLLLVFCMKALWWSFGSLKEAAVQPLLLMATIDNQKLHNVQQMASDTVHRNCSLSACQKLRF